MDPGRDEIGWREGSARESGCEEDFPVVLHAKTVISHLRIKI